MITAQGLSSALLITARMLSVIVRMIAGGVSINFVEQRVLQQGHVPGDMHKMTGRVIISSVFWYWVGIVAAVSRMPAHGISILNRNLAIS